MSDGFQKATAAAIATQLDNGCYRFLREMAKWDHIATPHNLGPQTSQDENRARQMCKRKGLVEFSGGYWRTTEIGKLVVTAMRKLA